MPAFAFPSLQAQLLYASCTHTNLLLISMNDLKKESVRLLDIFYCFLLVLSISSNICCNDDIYMQDRYGNIVFNNRSMKYVRPIPVGKATYTTNLYYDAKGLGALYDSARSFVQDVQPNSFPFGMSP